MNNDNGIDIEPVTNTSSEVYTAFRSTALHITASDLGLVFPPGAADVYGLVMDWQLGEETLTLACFATGDASLYFSSGAGVIGGIAHEDVRNSTLALVVSAAENIIHASLPDGDAMPGNNEIKFHWLTTAGRYSATEKMANMENGSSIFLDLFNEVNFVIDQLDKIKEGPNAV